MENVLSNKQKRLTERSKMLFVVYMMLTITAYTLPMLKITLPYIVVALLLLASIVVLVLKNSKWMYQVIVLCLSTLIVVTIGMLTGVYGLVDAINELIRNVRFFLPVLWGCFALKYCDKKHHKFIMITFGILCVYILIKTLNVLQSVPDVCRELAKSTTYQSSVRTEYRMQNVGGFEYSYMMGVVTLGFVWNAVTSKNQKIKILSLIAAVVCYYFVIQTMYTLLLILVFIGTLLIFYFTTKKILVKGIIAIGVILGLTSMEPFLKFLSELFSFNYGLEEKFTSMYLALRYDDVDIVGSRPELMKAALVNWLEHPILGGMHSKDSNSHSFIMNVLEDNGVIGLSVWVGLFSFGWKQIRSFLSHKTLFDVTMIYVLLLSLFNPIGYVFEITFVAYLIIPVWTCVFSFDESAE